MVRFNRATQIAKFTAATVISFGFGAALTVPALAQLTPVPIPTIPTNGALVPLNPTPAANQPNFAFTNVLEYSDCLAAILDAYLSTDSSLPTRQNLCQVNIQQAAGNDGLSHSEALELISAADFYSTHFLARALYPPKGLRLRIAENFGFIYQIDQNDPEVLRRAAR
jgi:hypothetical protein